MFSFSFWRKTIREIIVYIQCPSNLDPWRLCFLFITSQFLNAKSRKQEHIQGQRSLENVSGFGLLGNHNGLEQASVSKLFERETTSTQCVKNFELLVSNLLSTKVKWYITYLGIWSSTLTRSNQNNDSEPHIFTEQDVILRITSISHPCKMCCRPKGRSWILTLLWDHYLNYIIVSGSNRVDMLPYIVIVSLDVIPLRQSGIFFTHSPMTAENSKQRT